MINKSLSLSLCFTNLLPKGRQALVTACLPGLPAKEVRGGREATHTLSDCGGDATWLVEKY